jgi:HEAT repeat protein
LVNIHQPIRQSIAELLLFKQDFFLISVKMSSIPDETTVEKLSSMLVDTSLPLKLRFRILFTLKNLDSQHQQQSGKTSAVVEAISRAFDDTSALLKHECAYCLGQMGNTYAIAKLIEILNDSNEDSMVRHEAGLR